MPPAVSIVVPTRNRAAWLPRALDSVLAQDYPDLELVVVVDGEGDDGTRAVLEDYERSQPPERFRVVSQPGTGQANAVNHGWELARGEILGQLGDDDRLLPCAVSRLVEALVAEPAAAVAYPAYRCVQACGTSLTAVLPLEYSSEKAVRLHDTIIGTGALLRRWALERAGGWDPAFRWQVDPVFWTGLGLQGPAIRVPEVLAEWTVHGGSITFEFSTAHAREHIRAAQAGLTLLPEPSPEARAEALRNACVVAAIFEGPRATWPGDRYIVIDLLRPLVFGRVGHHDADRLPDATSEETAALWRGAAACLPSPPGGGTEIGLERLRIADELAGRPFRATLLDAAIDFGADAGDRDSRFAIFRGDAALQPLGPLAERALFGFPDASDDWGAFAQA